MASYRDVMSYYFRSHNELLQRWSSISKVVLSSDVNFHRISNENKPVGGGGSCCRITWGIQSYVNFTLQLKAFLDAVYGRGNLWMMIGHLTITNQWARPCSGNERNNKSCLCCIQTAMNEMKSLAMVRSVQWATIRVSIALSPSHVSTKRCHHLETNSIIKLTPRFCVFFNEHPFLHLTVDLLLSV